MCDSMWSVYLHLERSLRMRRVTWPLTGGKNSPHFWNRWLQFTYWLRHFQGATTKIKPCYRLKIAFFHCEGYKVYCACAVLRDLCTGGPLKPHVTIFWPRIVYSLYNFYGATTMINGSFMLEHHHDKAFSAGKSPIKLSPQNGGFFSRKFKGLNIKYSYRDPKRHFLTRNDVFWRTLRKNPFRGVGCSLIEEPKNEEKSCHLKSTAKSRIYSYGDPKRHFLTRNDVFWRT